MVYYADMPVDAYVDYLSVHHKLLAAMGAEPVAIIPDHDFKKVGVQCPWEHSKTYSAYHSRLNRNNS